MLQFTPKVHASNRNSDGTAIYIMERLLPESESLIKQSYSADPYIWEYLAFEEGSILAGYIHKHIITKGRTWRDFEENPKHPFTKLLHKLRQKCDLDLHAGNLMFRANGQLVLNDPVTTPG